MRKLLFSVAFFLAVTCANSQNLTVEGTAPNLYITHTVAPKENFYSVGRLYNQAPKTIATFNNITMEKGLTIGQKVKIPLNAQNLDAGGSAAAGETLIPLTHIVSKSETLFKIGTEHNASAQSIRQWNNLSSDNIAPGTPLVVGHLKIKNDQTAALKSTANTTVVAAEAPAAKPVTPAKQTSRPEVRTDDPVASQPRVTPKKDTAPVNNANESLAGSPVPVKKEPVRETPKEAPPKEEARETAKAAENSRPANIEERRPEMPVHATGAIEGVFAANFVANGDAKSLSTKNGEAGTFKSTSGWQDKKYYVLMNDVAPGTILKIASNDNKVVYAKVLGSMPDMKENNGLLLRISNAAASYLGIIDPKFPVQVSFYQ